MRCVYLLPVLVLLAIAATGCQKARLRVQLKELMGSPIALPERVSCVKNGETYVMPDSLRGKAKLIIYVDSTECTTCRVTHLPEYGNLFDISREKGSFEVMLLLANVDLSGVSLTRYLSDLEYGLPIYVDEENKFLELNPSIPVDKKNLHAILTNYVGKPICVGDPSVSERMLQLFMKAVDELNN